MKILLVHNFYQSRLIGGEDIVFNREKKSLENRLGAENVFEYTVSNDQIQVLKLLFTIWINFRHYYHIQKIIKKNKINIVHVHNYFPLLTPAIFKAAKRAGAKVVLTLHNFRQTCLSGILYRKNKGICHDCMGRTFAWPGVKQACYRGSRVQSLMAAMAFWWYKKSHFWDYIDEYWVLSKTQLELASKYINKNIIFIKPNGINNIDILDNKNKINLHKSDPSFRSGFLFVGRLEVAKGIDWLLAAWKAIPDNPILYIIGGGEREAELKLKYNHQSNIQFLGQLSHDEVINWMRKVNYFIHPGLMYETFGLTVIEAMQQGTPVIGLAIGTRVDFIQDGVNGFLVDRLDMNLFKEKIVHAIRIADTANNHLNIAYINLSNQAKIFASQFEMSKITEKQIQAYHRLCKTE